MNYTERVNRLAALKTSTESQERAWVELIAQLAAAFTGAADNGHVTQPVHRMIEHLIMDAEAKMKLPI